MSSIIRKILIHAYNETSSLPNKVIERQSEYIIAGLL